MISVSSNLPIYLDFCATTPVDQAVSSLVMRYMVEDFGNAGSRTHEMGATAKRAVEHGRRQLAAALSVDPGDIIFTSGATESNNLVILGLAEYGRSVGKTHIITTAIEHKSVLEPCRFLESKGFSVSYVSPALTGAVLAEDILNATREDTLLATIIHANNETGIIQPVNELIRELHSRDILIHSDASQTFCKLPENRFLSELDFVSISGHKISGPKGIGALAVNRRRHAHRLLQPIMYGGGQEYGLRPGTVAVALVAGFGLAADTKISKVDETYHHCLTLQNQLLSCILDNGFSVIGTGEKLPNCLCVDFCPIDAEAIFVALRESYCLSNGSACTSNSRSKSHVLTAMNLPHNSIDCSVRISWDTNTLLVDLVNLINIIASIR